MIMLNAILEDREKRYNELLSLLEKYKMTVLCGKINYPGEDKNTEEVKLAFTLLARLLNERFSPKLKYMTLTQGFDGPAILMVLDMTAADAKKAAVKLEATEGIGRVFDIDIYIETGASVGRNDINMEARKCIICGDEGRICTKAMRHSVDEVKAAFNAAIREYGEKHD